MFLVYLDGFHKAVKASMGGVSSGTDRYTKIMGNAMATAERMKAYLKKNANVAQSVLDMIPLCLSEGKEEGVRVSIPDFNIWRGPGTNDDKTGKYTGIGAFTIVDEADGEGASKWGKLKSNAGWVSLDYAKRM